MNKKDYSASSVSVSFVWRLLERFGAQGITLIISIILARILDPSVYGTIALVSVITTILQVFVDSGLGNALVQKKDSDNLDFSTVFTFNIIFSFVLYFIFFILSTLIVDFYDIGDMLAPIRVLGVIIIIAGFKGVQQAYVSKYLLYKKFFFATLAGTITASIVGIYLAYNGYGIWALIIQNIANQLIDTLVLWLVIGWKPKIEFSFNRFKRLFSYGWKFLATGLINQIYDETRTLIIGKRYSSSDLAFYNKGRQFPNVIANNLTSSVDSVLLPVMSDKQNDLGAVRTMTRQAMKVGSFLIWPCMIGLAAVSHSFVSLFLTDKWLPAVPYLQIFCIVYAFYPIHSANLNAIKAIGRSDVYLYQEVIKKVVGISIILFTMQFGVYWIAIGCIFNSFAAQIINSFPNRKFLDYTWGQQFLDILPTLLISIIMGLCVYLIELLNLSNWLTLLIQIPFGIILYIGFAWLFRIESFEYCLNIIRRIIFKKSKNKKTTNGGLLM